MLLAKRSLCTTNHTLYSAQQQQIQNGQLQSTMLHHSFHNAKIHQKNQQTPNNLTRKTIKGCPLKDSLLLLGALHECALKFHLQLSLFISKGASVGVLSPMDTKAYFSFELGITLGIMRYVPSVN